MKKVLKRVSGLLAFAVFVLVITALVKTNAASAACNHSWSPAGCFAPETCKYCHTTRGSALGHNYAAATCTSPKKCTRCGTTSGSSLGHSAGSAATCTSAQKCTRCSTTIKAALGHDYAAATCFAPATCKRTGCHATTGSPAGHSAGAAATCTTAQTCTKCGAQIKAALGHSWKDATCTTAKTCTRCKTTSGSALGHSAGAAATCTTAQKCTRCSTTIKAALGHDYAAATCFAPATCKRTGCHATTGSPAGHSAGAAATCTTAQTCTKCGAQIKAALGHSWQDATCTTAKTCTRCKTTSGSALGHSAGAAATCTTAQTCTRCKTQIKAALGHDYAAATCFAPKTCKRTGCQATTGSPAGHSYTTATCTKDRECNKCGYVDKGSALGHAPGTAATCTTAQTCTRCKAQLTAALGHNPGAAATCTTAQKCTRCSTVVKAALGHDWSEATCFAPKTCKRTGCQATTGSPVGHSYTEATCTKDRECKKCGYVDKGSALGHAPGTAATCTSPQKCTRSGCGAVIKEALGHSAGAAATCTTAQTCTRCKTQLKAALGHDWSDATCSAPTTCKRYGCHETSGSALGHAPGAAATCTSPQKCTRCGVQIKAALGHNWKDATCTDPKTCTRCGETSGSELGHNWSAATCTAPKKCSRCYKTDGTAAGHDWSDATCSAPTTCKRYGCHETSGSALGHAPGAAATCTSPQKCTRCGVQIKAALGHNWKDATCTDPKTCTRCGETSGTELGHNWSAATCTAPKKCSRCYKSDGKALGHDWSDATCFAAATCKRTGCQATTGSPVGHNYTEATCTKDSECKKCGFVDKGSALGHKPGAAATCTSPQKCTRSGCGAVIEKALGHKPGTAATCTDAQKCSRCKEVIKEALGHNWDAASCFAAATCKRTGCHETSGEPLGHSYKAGSTKCERCGYEKQEAKTVKVSFDVNGGSDGGYITGITAKFGEKYGSLPAGPSPMRGYRFLGWYTAKTGGTRVTSDTIVGFNYDHTLYAHYEANKYTIAFDGNGSTSGSMSSIVARYDSNVTLPANKFAKSDYDFAGWNTSKDGTGTKYADKESVKNLTGMNDGTVTLYAQWAKGYTITFDENGGYGGPDSQKGYIGSSVKLSTIEPKKDGSAFMGWSLDWRGTKTYKPGAQFPDKEDASIEKYILSNGGNVTLYAIWGEELYTVTFYPNGAPDEEVEEKQVYYNTTITTPIYLRENYIFAGWSKVPENNGKIDFAPSEKITVTASMDLYAVWTKEYTITYDDNEGTDGPGNQKGRLGSSVALSKKEPKRDGYAFLGWSLDWQGTKLYKPGAQFPDKEDAYIDEYILSNQSGVTLYAIWAANTEHIVTFVHNNGTNKTTKKTMLLNEKVTGPILSKDGYVFLGWSEEENSSKATYKPAEEIKVTGDMTLYGVWGKIKEYTLTFDYNDGTGKTEENVVLSGTKVKTPWPSRKGYVFIGWSRSTHANARVEYGPNEQITVKKDMTLYAIWKKEVTITLVYNDGNNRKDSILSYMGGNVIMPGPRKVMDGYSLIGWSKSPEQGASIDYEIGETVQVTEDITLYAKWVQKRVVNYDLNGGTSKVPIEPQVIGFEDEIKLTTAVPERRFHVFLGWAIDTLPGATLYKPGASFPDENDAFYDQYNMDGGNITLYAIWQKIADDEMIINLQKKYGERKLPDNLFLTEGTSEEWIKLSTGAYGVIATTTEDHGGVDFYFNTVYIMEKQGDKIKFDVYGAGAGLSTVFELHVLESHSNALGVSIVFAGRALKDAVGSAADAAVAFVIPGGQAYLLTRDLLSMISDLQAMWDTIRDSYSEFEDMMLQTGSITVNGVTLGPDAWDTLCSMKENGFFTTVFETADDSIEELFNPEYDATSIASLVLDLIDFWSMTGRSCLENVDPYGGLDEVASYYVGLLEDDGFGPAVTSGVGSVLAELYNTVVVSVESIEDYTVMAIDGAKKAQGYIGAALNKFMSFFK